MMAKVKTAALIPAANTFMLGPRTLRTGSDFILLTVFLNSFRIYCTRPSGEEPKESLEVREGCRGGTMGAFSEVVPN